MSYTYEVIKDRPIRAYPLSLGETATFSDISGSGVNGTVTGTVTAVPPLPAVAGHALRVPSTASLQFVSGIFQLDDSKGFSLEVWFKPIVTGKTTILGHTGQDDGIVFDGTSIRFTTNHGAAGPASCSFVVPKFSSSFHAVGVHTEFANRLYVNGDLVAEVTITTEQALAGFSNPNDTLYAGLTQTGTPVNFIDFISVYNYALEEERISRHYASGRDVIDFRDITANRDATFFDMTDLTSVTEREEIFETTSDWLNGVVVNLSIGDDGIIPTFKEDGTTKPGYWYYGFPLTTVDGSKIQWDSTGEIVVQSSVDDSVSWQTCINGQEIPGVTAGMVTTGKSVAIRVSIAESLPATTTARMNRLQIKIYKTRAPLSNNARRTMEIINSASMPSQRTQPIELYDFMGLNPYNGYAKINKDLTEFPLPTRSVDLWIKFNDFTTDNVALDFRDSAADANVYLAGGNANGAMTMNGGVMYVNGSVSTATYTFNKFEWYHIVIVLTADNFKSHYLGQRVSGVVSTGKYEFGPFSIYPTALTATQAGEIYSSYFSRPVLSHSDPVANVRQRQYAVTGGPAINTKAAFDQWFPPDPKAAFVSETYLTHLPVTSHVVQNTSFIHEGSIYLDTAGTWEFGFDSDDAGELTFNGNIITSFYGGRAMGTAGNHASVVIATPGYYKFILKTQNTGGGGGFALYHRTPAVLTAAGPRTIVPASMLRSTFTESNKIYSYNWSIQGAG